MTEKFRVVAVAAALAIIFSASGARAQGGPPEPSLEGKTASQAYKNIQVLKDIPAYQLIPTMQFISASLGVHCEFCHVEHHFDQDDKEQKKTARKMMTMMLAIDKDNFNGRQEVTCNTCHNGSAHPAGIPVITENEMTPAPAGEGHGGEAHGPNGGGPAAGENGAASPPPLPTADHIIDQYYQAIGGADALAKITSRVEKGNLQFGDRKIPIEIEAKAPDMRMSIAHMPNGDSITAFDGKSGWLSGMGRPPRAMSPIDNGAAAIDAYFNLPASLKEHYQRLFPRPPEKVGDQEANVVIAFTRGQPPVKLYFDQTSGLLVRMEHYNQTALGLLPIQIDYADYRDADGIKVPFQWTVSRPGGHFTIQIDNVQQNVPVDDSKFAMPAAPPASAAPGGNPPAN
jgi:photosynthetic reaction center cytochrome c subunit